MRIGEFAKKYGISIDTVRFYVNEGLLIPIRDGYHYQFDEQCSADLENIISLKNAGFSLREVKLLVLSENLSTYAPEERKEKCQDIYLKKHRELTENIRALSRAQRFIEERLNQLNCTPKEPQPFGVTLDLLPFLACPRCGSRLVLQSAKVEQGKVINGSFVCSSCPYSLTVSDGILTAEPAPEIAGNYSSFDHFITQADPNLMVSILQNVKWMRQHLYKSSRPLKIILEIGSGFGFFLRNTYDLVPDDSLYIAVDYDKSRQMFLKKALQNCSCSKNIVLVCCGLEEIPLKPHTADQIIDFGTATDLAWCRPEFTLEIIDRYTHGHTECMFVNRAYEKFNFASHIKPESRRYLMEKPLLEAMESLHYRIVNKERLEFPEKLQPVNQFMSSDDMVYRLLIHMKKDAAEP